MRRVVIGILLAVALTAPAFPRAQKGYQSTPAPWWSTLVQWTAKVIGWCPEKDAGRKGEDGGDPGAPPVTSQGSTTIDALGNV